MRSKDGNITPKEAALIIAMEGIKTYYFSDEEFADDRPSFQRKIREHLAKEFNKMSDRIGGDDWLD